MSNALPQTLADYLSSPQGKAALSADAIWFRWNLETKSIQSSGNVLKSTPEQMSRPRTTVFVRAKGGPWKRYA